MKTVEPLTSERTVSFCIFTFSGSYAGSKHTSVIALSTRHPSKGSILEAYKMQHYMEKVNMKDAYSGFGDPSDERARKFVVLDAFRDEVLLGLSICRSASIFFTWHFDAFDCEGAGGRGGR